MLIGSLYENLATLQGPLGLCRLPVRDSPGWGNSVLNVEVSFSDFAQRDGYFEVSVNAFRFVDEAASAFAEAVAQPGVKVLNDFGVSGAAIAQTEPNEDLDEVIGGTTYVRAGSALMTIEDSFNTEDDANVSLSDYQAIVRYLVEGPPDLSSRAVVTC